MSRSTPFARSKSRTCSGAIRWRPMRRCSGAASPARWSWFPALAGRSARNCAGRSCARGPSRLVLVELSEFALYSIEQELAAICARMNANIELVPLLGSVMHQHRIEMAMRSFGVQTVYHAAAYKHVPLVEHNPIEGIRNNSLGTRRMAEAALAAGSRDLRADFDRQGGAPDQRDGRQQASGRTGTAGAGADEPHDALLHGALRQRAGIVRVGGAAVSQADRRWRADYADPPGDHALFHDHSRGRATGDPGRLDGRRRRGVCAGHGAAGQDHRSGTSG